MFLFVFAVLLIGIVGLFFQVVAATSAFINGQSTVAGESVLHWQAMARDYACLTPGDNHNDPDNPSDPVNVGIKAMQSSYAGDNWSTEIFSGSYGGTPGERLVMTYLMPTDPVTGAPKTYLGGIPAGEVARQMVKSGGNRVIFGRVYACGGGTGECVNVTVTGSTAATTANFTVTGIPTRVPLNSFVTVNTASLPCALHPL